MSEKENLDISKIIGLIMENPQLIEQISNLAKQSDNTTPEPAKEINETPGIEQTIAAPISPTYSNVGHSRGNRAQLLGALKPYVSEERAKAIDSMISIADILDMMRAR